MSIAQNQTSAPEDIGQTLVELFLGYFKGADKPLSDLQTAMFATNDDVDSSYGREIDLAIG